MQRIATVGDRSFHLLRQPAPTPLAESFDGATFACLIWDCGGPRTVEERTALVSKSIEQGCRYFVCAGHDASAWENAIDDAFVQMTVGLPESEIDRRMVMTTAHDGEWPDEVAFFFANCVSLENVPLERFLVLIIGTDDLMSERVCSALRENAAAT